METLKDIKLNGLRLKLVRGDITKYRADAIVNAANKYLEHRGGVALAIAKACMEEVESYIRICKDEMKKQIGREYIEHGEVVVTPSFNLEAAGIRYVIHTVGPICHGEWNEDLKEKLRRAIMAPLKKAEELGINSIAFPTISAGIYGCPFEEVVKTFLEVVRDFAKSAKKVNVVSLVVYDEKSANSALKVFTL